MAFARSYPGRWFALAIVLWGLSRLMFPAHSLADTPAFQDFPATPIIRIETGMHTASIWRIDVDREERFLVSGSDDKTVRIWELQTGRLIRTLRAPVGEGNVGKIYSVAISPDGAFVAAGGWTGWGPGTNTIYIYQRETGDMTQVIQGLPNVIHHLKFSPDGRYLAATLGSNGLRVYETSAYQQISADTDYGDRSTGADFDALGRLVAVGSDGYIRLYDRNFRLIQKKKAPGGSRPCSAAFSPDGRQIAVGYDDSTRVDVLSAETLELVFSADTANANNGNFCTVAWSKDGRFFYAGGRYYVGGICPLRCWAKGGQGDFTEFKPAQNTIMGIRALSNGKLALGAGDPLLAVLSAGGQALWQQTGEMADFRGQIQENAIRLSGTGDAVQFGYEEWGKRPARFSLKTSQLELGPAPDTRLTGPVTQAEGLNITGWINTMEPKLNGQALALDRYEISRSLAIASDKKRFLLGTDWSLMLFDSRGGQIWRIPVPGTAWAVNISADGRLAVAGFGDGTLRWYRLEDGKEILALFPHKDGRWVAFTPNGFYQASAGAEDLIGWHLNQGSAKAPEFFGASRFREQFYRPDVLARVLETLDVDQALALADKDRGEKTVATDLKTILPPTIQILSPAPGTKTASTTLTLFYKAESAAGPVTDVEARVDGRKTTVLKHEFEPAKADKFLRTGQITIEAPPKSVTVSLIAKNQHAASEPADFLSIWEGTPDWQKPSLYVLAVGVSRYSDSTLDLKYAHKDAQDFARAIKAQEGGLYKKVSTRLLVSDEKNKDATQEKILDGLDWLMRETTSRDVAMVFLSGHGTNDARGNYHFCPAARIYQGSPGPASPIPTSLNF
nr:hypothetical protein [Desulfobacula sp.]